MILPALIIFLLAGGILAWSAEKINASYPKWIALAVLAIYLVVMGSLWSAENTTALTGGSWKVHFMKPWIPQFGVSFHLALDGLSLLMLLLTFFLGMAAVLISWKEIQNRVGFFYFNMLWVLAGISGVFLAMDLFLFYFFWEMMLIPMYFLIGIWGHENRRYAAYKFFIFTQASGLLMLLAVLGMYFVHGATAGEYTFDYFAWLGTPLSTQTGRWLMLGFLAAFIVKLPVVPFHSWLPDAHAEAPTAGSVILAGLLLKTGAYGLIRFVVPLFPEASHYFAPVLMGLGVLGILYGAILAFAQTDIKRLVAYTSVSHMGFVMLGVFAFNEVAMKGVVMQMITHGISTGALFILAGVLYERIHTRDINHMGGFWPQVPFMGTMGLVFAMASLGLPGLGNFVAEILTLLGAWQANHTLTILATVGLVAATAYSLRIVQKIFLGKPEHHYTLPDLSGREKLILVPLVVAIVWLGLFPQAVMQQVDQPAKAGTAQTQVTTSGLLVNQHVKGGEHDPK
ncbi:NADH-quinone oxidoreductase subunit M [Chryseolinea lacunae]|uniref:NADH-quinone oxidoreductase subunit M n=1 Tax=Chryseolinea lacunae TaxID=2801331 RepID=A0ABS1KXS5_9BACT|nr:NADH-quinone oxidoreductase subunit M [Chryseolinea lacunae]MBL0744266.1 NADH-quinone oxidoreductase subunit M [Chryseolinea lacunae]